MQRDGFGSGIPVSHPVCRIHCAAGRPLSELRYASLECKPVGNCRGPQAAARVDEVRLAKSRFLTSHLRSLSHTLPLTHHSIDFHPELPYEFALAGEDSIIRQYDVRAATRGPIMCYRQTCESGQTYTRRHQGGVSSIRFSRRATGTCLLANYRNAPMALFDASVGSKKRAPVLFFESRDNSASSAKRIGAQHADDGVTSPMMTLMEGPVASEVSL